MDPSGWNETVPAIRPDLVAGAQGKNGWSQRCACISPNTVPTISGVDLMSVRFSNRLVAELNQPFWAAWQGGEFLTDASALAGTHRKRGLAWLRELHAVHAVSVMEDVPVRALAKSSWQPASSEV